MFKSSMNIAHLTGDLVNIVNGSLTGLIIATTQSNRNPLNSGRLDNSYPWVYYVLISDGLIKGPLFASEIRTLYLINTFKLINVNT